MVERLTLNDGGVIPQLGLGVWQVPAADVSAVVGHALAAGYRHIDTAAAYGNEEGVGEALRGSALAREDVFLTTKVWNGDHGRDRALAACRKSLQRLDVEWVDLLLIHWPVPSAGKYVDAWEGLIAARDAGLARSIGVSNFNPDHLERIIDSTGVVPAVNQIELHPGFMQPSLRAFHAQHGIVTEAWSPLGQGQVLRDPAVLETAGAVGRTPAQVVIRWHLQLGNIVIPKSVTPSRIEENFDVDGFSLSHEQMEALASLTGSRIGPDPATFSFGA